MNGTSLKTTSSHNSVEVVMTYGLAVTKLITLGHGKMGQLLEIGHTGKRLNLTDKKINACTYGEHMVFNGSTLITRDYMK
jgi:hypothetical protein